MARAASTRVGATNTSAAIGTPLIATAPTSSAHSLESTRCSSEICLEETSGFFRGDYPISQRSDASIYQPALGQRTGQRQQPVGTEKLQQVANCRSVIAEAVQQRHNPD